MSDYDTSNLLSDIARHNAEDAERASSAGESRADIKEVLEKNGLHPRVYSFLRSLTKVKKDEVALDIIRSMRAAFETVASDIEGRATKDAFGTPSNVTKIGAAA